MDQGNIIQRSLAKQMLKWQVLKIVVLFFRYFTPSKDELVRIITSSYLATNNNGNGKWKMFEVKSLLIQRYPLIRFFQLLKFYHACTNETEICPIFQPFEVKSVGTLDVDIMKWQFQKMSPGKYISFSA